MRRLPLCALAAALVAASAPAAAQEQGVQPLSTGLAASVSLGGGTELGLEEDAKGGDGVLEAEVTIGWELQAVGVRPELSAALGLAPDGHVALRPGLRWSLPGLPIQLRVALDASNARDTDMRWRWLLVGAAGEIRFTSLLGLYGEIDTGAPLGSEAGLPLLLRAGASFRF